MRAHDSRDLALNRGSVLPSYLALGVGVLCLGFSAIFVRWAHAPGVVTSFYRMAIAVALVAGPYLWRKKTAGEMDRAGVRLAALGGLFFAADLGLWATGVVMSGATNPTLLANTAPLWVGLGTVILSGKRLRPVFWTGLAVAIVGAAVIVGRDSLRATAFGLGSLLGVLAAVFYGGYYLITERGRETLDSLGYTWVSSVSTAIVLLAVCLLLRQPLAGYTRATYLNFVALGVVTQGIGYLAINYAVGHLPASLVAPVMLGQPVVTAILAGPLLAEALSPVQAAGGVAVIAGVYAVIRSHSSTAS